MKRRLLIIASFLLLGAVGNVAVAWTCVVFADLAMKEGGWDDRGPSMEKRWIGDHGWSAGKDSDICYNILLTQVAAFGLQLGGFVETKSYCGPGWGLHLDGSRPIGSLTRAGWPLPCLYGGKRNASPRSAWGVSWDIHAGISVQWISDELADRVIPLCPLWFPFIINTIFYAAIL